MTWQAQSVRAWLFTTSIRNSDPVMAAMLDAARERVSRYGASEGPGQRSGTSALALLDDSQGLVFSDGTPEAEALRDAVDGPELIRSSRKADALAREPAYPDKSIVVEYEYVDGEYRMVTR